MDITDPYSNYKPSLWLTVNGFTSKEGDEADPQVLAQLHKGDPATINDQLAYSETAGDEFSKTEVSLSTLETPSSIAQHHRVGRCAGC